LKKGFIAKEFFNIIIFWRNAMFNKSLLVFLFFMVFISCSPKIMAPPEIDLLNYERVGLISFSSNNVESQADEMATKLFLQEISSFQKRVQVIELGTLDEVLGLINKATLNQGAVKAIGEHFGVASFFHGEINVSDVKRSSRNVTPKVITRVIFRMTLNISLTIRLYSTETGATLWADSAYKEKNLDQVLHSPDSIPDFDIKAQNEVHKKLAEHLVHELIRDFRPSKMRP
jgi:hypothetical protein